MQQPEFFKKAGDIRVCKLKKSIYGLKQGARSWYKKWKSILCNEDFKRSQYDHCLFSRHTQEGSIYVGVYVDDIATTASNKELFQLFEDIVKKHVRINYLGPISNYLGIQINRSEDGTFFLHQTKYIDEKLCEFNLQKCKPSKYPIDPGYRKEIMQHNISEYEDKQKYRSLIGSLLYLSNNTRPDIAAAVGILAQKVSEPRRKDWVEAQRVFRYISGTRHLRLRLGNQDTDTPEIGRAHV